LRVGFFRATFIFSAANEFIASLYAAHGDTKKARAQRDSKRGECALPPGS
jgi:hypothetical protein